MAGLLDRFRNRNLRNRIKNPHDEYWDRKLGVHTFGAHPGSGPWDGLNTNLPFVPSAYADAFRYLKAADIGPDDVFVDLGAGYGRTAFVASWLGARRAVGVDLVQTLMDGAEANRVKSVLRDRDIEFICANALDFNEPDMSILYMFHPFGEAILEKVLSNLGEARSQQANPPKLRIVYANPVYEGALVRTGWLRKTLELPAETSIISSSSRYHASIWEAF
jgi:SAM-dependent methyltransferase